MSKFDKYRTTDDRHKVPSKFDKYRESVVTIKPYQNINSNAVSQSTIGDSWGQVLPKAVGKFATEIAGLPNLVSKGIESITNAGNKMYGAPVGLYGMGTYGQGKENPPNIRIDKNAPQTDYAQLIPSTESINKGIQKYTGIDIEPHPSNAEQRIAYNALDFGLNTLPFTAISKAAKGASLLDKFKKVGKVAGEGSAIGGASGVLQEADVNPLVADVTASVITPTNPKNLLNAFKKTKEVANKIPMKIMGLSPKGLNIEAARSARDLGIDLPAAALTSSTLTGLADQWLGKTPFFGNRLKKKYATTEEQTAKALEDIYENTGPSRTDEIEAQIAKLYNERAKALPQDARVKPTNLKNAIDNTKIDSALLSPDEKSLLQNLEILKNEIEPQSQLISQFGKVKLPLQEFDVNRLIGTKTSLNQIIKWDMDEGIKNQLRRVQKAISKDIAEYGKTNPEWYETFKEADRLYGSVAKREKLENLLSGKGTNYASGDLSYNSLAKIINNPDQLALIKKQTNPETFNKIQKLGIVARSMAIKSKSIPNPSGTAMTGTTIGLITGLATNPVATLSGSGIGAIIGAQAAAHLLTDKKFLDLALKFAENPNSKSNLLTQIALNKRVKDITGYSAITLNREMQRALQSTNESGSED